DFLVRLRSDFRPPLPPVVVCSGFDTTESEAMRLGATRFLAKPCDASALLTAVRQTLRGEQADEATLSREREYVREARSRAAQAPREILAGAALQAPDTVRKASTFAQWVSDYFGVAPAALLFVEGGDVRVVGASRDCPVPAGTLIAGRMLYTTGVLAAGA